MTLSQLELARYLGRNGAALPPALCALAEQCEWELFRSCRPRRTGRRMELAALPGLSSDDLTGHLDGCSSVYLTALTLGTEADRLLRLWAAQSMAKATLGHALAAVWLDDCCDVYAQELEKGNLQEGEYLLPAYSPGYGDFSLSWQTTLLRLLDAPRKIGLSLTAGGMLAPEKSVTALLGITKQPSRGCSSRCMLCAQINCPFRKGS